MACISKRRGRYVLDYYDDQGCRSRKTLKKGATLKAAKTKLREIEEQLARGVYIDDRRMPTFEKVADYWLETKKSNIRESTWTIYESHVRNHLAELRNMQINRITTGRIEKMIAGYQLKGQNIGTIRKTMLVLG